MPLNPPSSKSGGGLQLLAATLSSAQILALNSTPVTVVPAPGAGLTLVPILTYAELVFVTAAYTAGGQVDLIYTGDTGLTKPHYTLAAAATITAAVNTVQAELFGGNSPSFTATAANAGTNLGLDVRAETANFATGSGTLNITIIYATVPVV